MATYNGARFIREQLDSLAAQTLLPIELVVGDDGSTDGTMDVLESFAGSAPFPVRITRNVERLGYAANFMACASRCLGDVISFCDQDDIWAATKLEACARVLQKDSSVMVFHNAAIFRVKGSPIRNLYNHRTELTANPLDRGPWFIALGFTIVFKADLLSFSDLWYQSFGFQDKAVRATHDQWISFVANVCGPVSYISVCLADYRLHDGNVSLRNRRSAAEFITYLRKSEIRAYSAHVYLSNLEYLLRRTSKTLTSPIAARFACAADRVGKGAKFMLLRSFLYSGSKLQTRSRIFLGLVKRHAYRSQTSDGLGTAVLLKDLLIGLPFAGFAHPKSPRTQMEAIDVTSHTD